MPPQVHVSSPITKRLYPISLPAARLTSLISFDNRAISSVNLLKNKIGTDQAKALISMLKEHPTLKSLCGNRGNETELDMSGKMDSPGDAAMLAAEVIDNGALYKLVLKDNKLATVEVGEALGEALTGNTVLKELDISGNYWDDTAHGRDKGDGPGFAKGISKGLAGNGALSSLNLARNSLGAEAIMGSTELYVEEKLVATAVADWASSPHRTLASDKLEVVSARPSLADGDITNVTEVLGKVVMVSRGGCSFVIKAQHLQAAGALAMVCVNNDAVKPDEVLPMGGDGAENITIPVVMVSFNTGAQIRAMAEMTVTIKRSFSLTDALKNHK
jgi:hypothetical protein